jgi:hypothetical protein
LEPNDVRGQTMDRIIIGLEARLQELREENDSGDFEATTKRRGRIVELKEWLALIARARQADSDAYASPSSSTLLTTYHDD